MTMEKDLDWTIAIKQVNSRSNLSSQQKLLTKVPKQNKQFARVMNTEVQMSDPELQEVSDQM